MFSVLNIAVSEVSFHFLATLFILIAQGFEVRFAPHGSSVRGEYHNRSSYSWNARAFARLFQQGNRVVDLIIESFDDGLIGLSLRLGDVYAANPNDELDYSMASYSYYDEMLRYLLRNLQSKIVAYDRDAIHGYEKILIHEKDIQQVIHRIIAQASAFETDYLDNICLECEDGDVFCETDISPTWEIRSRWNTHGCEMGPTWA